MCDCGKSGLPNQLGKKSYSIEQGIEAFLTEVRQRVKTDRRSAATLGTLKSRLEHVKKYVKGSVSNIDEQTIRGYYEFLQ